MKIEKSRIFIGDVYKSLSKYSTDNDIDDYNNFGKIRVAQKVLLVKFGKSGYVPVSKIKNSIHFLLLEKRVCSDGMLKYSPIFLSENNDMFSSYFVEHVKPAFSPEKKEENIDYSALKKFSKSLERQDKKSLENV